MAEITHYWDTVHLTNPYGVTWKKSDGSIVYGCAQKGSLPEETRPYPHEPKVIHGVNPDNPSEPMDFGEWRPVSEWLAQSAG